jgi:hypothetical protein
MKFQVDTLLVFLRYAPDKNVGRTEGWTDEDYFGGDNKPVGHYLSTSLMFGFIFMNSQFQHHDSRFQHSNFINSRFQNQEFKILSS